MDGVNGINGQILQLDLLADQTSLQDNLALHETDRIYLGNIPQASDGISVSGSDEFTGNNNLLVDKTGDNSTKPQTVNLSDSFIERLEEARVIASRALFNRLELEGIEKTQQQEETESENQEDFLEEEHRKILLM